MSELSPESRINLLESKIKRILDSYSQLHARTQENEDRLNGLSNLIVLYLGKRNTLTAMEEALWEQALEAIEAIAN